MRTVLVTGGFDPIHSGHLQYFNEAKKLGDQLAVGLNSDEWLTRKKGQPFMPFEERKNILENLCMVDHVFEFDDSDNTANKAIGLARLLGNSNLIFANGGDRGKNNVPEMDTWGSNPEVEFVFGVGGDNKKNSSSWILENWNKPITERAWGSYKILDKNGGWQVKELSFDKGKALSDQRHFNRSEHWHVVSGVIEMILEDRDGNKIKRTLIAGDSIDIPTAYWHKAINIGTETAKVIEVWLGKHLTEEDIERRD